MKALISPDENAQYISGWNNPVPPSKLYTPIYTACGERIVQVQEDEFPVALPLFWIDCANNVTPEINCYDGDTQTIILIPPNAADPNPPPTPPVTTGTRNA
jgi:hypothetical protein